MKTNIFYVSEEILIEAIRQLYPDKIKSKDYEYPISIYVKRIFERHDNKTYKITFELDNKHQESKKPLELTPEETVKILRTYLEENTPVDFGLAPVDKDGNFEGYGYPFQVKRFIGLSTETFLDDLIKFIENKSSHYRSDKTSLIVMPAFSVSLNEGEKAHLIGFSEDYFRTVANRISVNDKTLRAILAFSIKDGEPTLTQIWPNYGEY